MTKYKKTYRSPLFYVGDKYKLYPKISRYFPRNINRFIEPFTGGGSVFLNVRANEYLLNDIDTNVIRRHLYASEAFSDRLIKYLSFVAPVIHKDVKDFFDYSIVNSRSNGYEVNIKPYELQDFVRVTQVCGNFEDMKNHITNTVKEFRNKLNI